MDLDTPISPASQAEISPVHQNKDATRTRVAKVIFAVLMSGLVANTVSAQTFDIPATGDGLVGNITVVRAHQEDTLSDIARAHQVGFDEIVRANPQVDPWLPGEGTGVIVPMWHILPIAPQQGIVLNLPEMRIYYYPPPQNGKPATVMTFPVSIGRMDWSTPLGVTRVTAKVVNPSWYPPASVRAEHAAEGDDLPAVVPPGPDNPLGEYAIQLGIPGYFIHGTNKPYGIGMRVTHGCVRLYPEDIRLLFREVPVGTPVRIINQPYKAGWYRGVLYFEAHPPLEELNTDASRNLTPATRVVMNATTRPSARVDWERVTRAAIESRGLPIAILD